MIGKRGKFSGGSENVSVEAKVTSGGRLFQRRRCYYVCFMCK